ncbi:MAG: CRISPR-associated protein Cas5 [Candidatus Micrarchaeia archaeon]
MNVLAFVAEADFGVFRDPSITTSQITYTIPSKSTVIGLLGAILGISRNSRERKTYITEYIELLRETRIGIKVLDAFDRINIGTNHQSLKPSKKTTTKPFKEEFLINPRFMFFVHSPKFEDKLAEALSTNTFVYTPYLGHANCIARISNFQRFHTKPVEANEIHTDTVVLDPIFETHGHFFDVTLKKGQKFLIERHLHHFVHENKLQKRVLTHYIPINATLKVIVKKDKKIDVDELKPLFVTIGDSNVCLY